MRKQMLTAGVAVIGAVAATVVGTTVASAADSAPTIQHITVMSTHLNGPVIVIAQGPIHARGRDITVSNSIDRFVFPKGTIRIRHHRIGKAVRSFDPVTCYETAREHGAYAVVGGTGEYAGVRGKGFYHLQARAVECQNGPTRVFMAVLKAAGPLHR